MFYLLYVADGTPHKMLGPGERNECINYAKEKYKLTDRQVHFLESESETVLVDMEGYKEEIFILTAENF